MQAPQTLTLAFELSGTRKAQRWQRHVGVAKRLKQGLQIRPRLHEKQIAHWPGTASAHARHAEERGCKNTASIYFPACPIPLPNALATSMKWPFKGL
jgi:hypothetical protein